MYGAGGYDPRFMGGMNPMFGNNDPTQFLPPSSQPIDPNPRVAQQPTPAYNQGFFNNRNNANMFNGDDSFNVDDLIKKIDAKIAELEAEEKRETENTNTAKEPENKPVVQEPFVPQFEMPKPIENNPEPVRPIEPMAIKEEPVFQQPRFVPIEPEDTTSDMVVNINPDIDKIINSSLDDENTDDQFFDDFFSDDDE